MDLVDILKYPLSEDEAKHIFIQIFIAINYLPCYPYLSSEYTFIDILGNCMLKSVEKINMQFNMSIKYYRSPETWNG